MITQVYLIRHGETEDGDTRRYKGHTEVPLSVNGIKQIKRLANYLHHNSEQRAQKPVPGVVQGNTDVTVIYTSDLCRAVKSAEIIAEPYGLKPIIVEGLRERNFGVWEGMTFDEIKERWPDAFKAWADNPLKFSPMEGESTIEVRDRALKTFNDIVERHKGEMIAIVAHGGINRVILCEMLGMPLENIFRIEQGFGALNVIELWDHPVVKQLNYTV